MMLLSTLTVLVFTWTRSAFLSLLCVIAGFLAISAKKILNKKILLILLLAIFGCISLTFSQYARRVISYRANATKSWKDDRVPFWKEGMSVFLNQPVLGVGIANYERTQCLRGKPGLPAHNQYIQLAAELGTVGLVVYLMLLVEGIRISYKMYSKANDAEFRFLGMGFLGFWIWYSVQSFFVNHLFADKYSMMFWIMVGSNAGLYRLFNETTFDLRKIKQ
jgi:O-antigen ligase